MTVPFLELFILNADGSYSPTKQLDIGGVQMDTNIRLYPGVAYMGVDIAQYIDKQLEVEKLHGGTIAIQRILG